MNPTHTSYALGTLFAAVLIFSPVFLALRSRPAPQSAPAVFPFAAPHIIPVAVVSKIPADRLRHRIHLHSHPQEDER